MTDRSDAGRATWRNWAGNQTCSPAAVERPRDVDEVVAAVKRAADRGLTVRVAGAGHSFTPAVLTDGVLVDISALDRVVDVTPGTGIVTVQAGMRLRALNRVLCRAGLAMSNLGDIDAQTVAGAISTGTHGTGERLGGLATQVRGMELVTADGAVVSCSTAERPELFSAARVGLGAFGVVTAVTFQCEPAFVLHAHEGTMPLDGVMAEFGELASRNDHFEFFWFPHTDQAMVKQNNRLAASAPAEPQPRWRAFVEDEVLGNGAFEVVCRIGRHRPSLIPSLNRRSVRLMAARSYTAPSHEVFTSPRRVRFVEMEYSVPRERVHDALTAVRSVIDRERLFVSFPVEVRVARGDDIPLSTASGRDSAYLAVHMYRGTPGYERFFGAVEIELAAMAGRPHWGKLHYRRADDLRDAYPRWDEFAAVRDAVDPQRRFTNDYLRRVLGS
jgi:FAD-linked oxidoreductase